MRRIGYVVLVFVVTLAAPLAGWGNETDRISAYFEQSLNHETAGDYNASLNNVLKILTASPRHYTATLRAGWLNYLKGDQANSEKYYRTAILLASDAIEPRLGLLLPLMAEKKWSEAEAAGRKVLQMDDRNYIAATKTAYALFEQGKHVEALALYQKALSWYPSDLEIKLGIGWTYQRMGRKAEASRYFREVLEVNRKNLSAISGMQAVGGEK